MFLAQASLRLAGWPPEQYSARDADDALSTGATWLTDDAEALIRAPALEIIIEATEMAAVANDDLQVN